MMKLTKGTTGDPWWQMTGDWGVVSLIVNGEIRLP